MTPVTPATDSSHYERVILAKAAVAAVAPESTGKALWKLAASGPCDATQCNFRNSCDRTVRSWRQNLMIPTFARHNTHTAQALHD
jgi:hypothetical protein